MKREYQDQPLGRSNWAWIRWFGFDQFVPERIVTSYWIPTQVLLGIRVLTMLYSTATMYASIAESAISHTFNTYFGYFTHLTFVGLHAYLVTIVYHHVRYVWSRQKNLDSFFKQPTTVNYLFVYLYHSIITFNIVTPIVYWGVLNSKGGEPTAKEMWVNVSVHGVSLGIMLIEVIFSRMKVYTNMIILILINVVIYMCLTFLVHAITGIWVYYFLDWSLGFLGALLYVGAGIAITILYFIMLCIHDLRDYIAQLTRCAPKEKISPRSMEWMWPRTSITNHTPSEENPPPPMASTSQEQHYVP